ncbi:LLM class flavin-dependent oxidoreductase [Streptomyces sp. NPDC020412]|uniref:LLM class flavin-dependent oxidoreductase n=1 Tax=Streptomyces sp. NPDC020412 TaxID=3365073 RepID=UPI003797F8D1
MSSDVIPAGSVGLNIDPSAADAAAAHRLAHLADEGGVDFVGVQDHLYHPEFLDAWTLITALAARTERLTLMPNVANTVLRAPAPLIKAAHSLSILTGGRVALGVGAGAAPPATAAYGGPERTPGQAVTAFEEALRVMRAMNGPGTDAVRFDGEHHHVRGARPGPFAERPVPLLVGAYRPRMLRITGRLGDGWLPSNGFAPPETIAAMQREIDAAAVAAGRDPREVRRVYNVMGTITDGSAPAAEGRRLTGPPDFWVETLLRYRADLGFESFLFWPVDADPEEQATRFIVEVAPRVRIATGQGGS